MNLMIIKKRCQGFNYNNLLATEIRTYGFTRFYKLPRIPNLPFHSSLHSQLVPDMKNQTIKSEKSEEGEGCEEAQGSSRVEAGGACG